MALDGQEVDANVTAEGLEVEDGGLTRCRRSVTYDSSHFAAHWVYGINNSR